MHSATALTIPGGIGSGKYYRLDTIHCILPG